VAPFITKPITYGGLVAVMNTLGRYWIEILELPNE
jgi:two-component system response regulator